MKILIDMSNSPHVLFFNPIVRELEGRGHKIYITAREHAQTKQLLDLYGKKYLLIGKHAGKSTFKKLINSFGRVLDLARIIERINPDVCLSHQSPYITYASFLKGKKNIYFFDNEKAKLQNWLTFPLATKIICPESITKKYRRFKKYPGVKEAVYLNNLSKKDIGLNFDKRDKRKKILIRTEIKSAAYHGGNSLFSLVRKLAKRYQVIVSTRNDEEVAEYKKINGILILERPVDGPSLINKVDLVMGGGGTMNREAAVMGKPVISLYSGELLDSDKYLINGGLMIHNTHPTEELIDRIINKKTNNKDVLDMGKIAIRGIVGEIERGNLKKKLKLMFVVASRPNFMKVAPLVKEAKKQGIDFSIFYVEQHKSKSMTGDIAKDLNLPLANYSLGINKIGGGKSKMGKGLDLIRSFARARGIIKKDNPSFVVVVGDVVSSAYIASVAKISGFKVAHVEAGLRSFNNKMPEERARIIIDKISDLLFTTEPAANNNLIKDGKNKNKIFFVGNVMIDSLMSKIGESKKMEVYKKFKLKKGHYAVLTFHRHENINNKKKLFKLIRILESLSKKIEIIFALHPSTEKQLIRYNFLTHLNKIDNLKIINPLSYQEMLSLVSDSKIVLTDSGGLQEETTILNIPCLTLRTETERPITVDVGTNTITGLNQDKIIKNVLEILNNKYKKGKTPQLWDGKSSERIIKIIENEYNLNK